ncbi:unnamed protein product [Arctia plantaginis]|uniref:DDE-1 domain-containing protein n=1 Tax=Arctia plantaginis TaxID=874455 RepID=A0A8S1AC68_ARCPL|nr:unnamed protein product [Arctia plantaginis]
MLIRENPRRPYDKNYDYMTCVPRVIQIAILNFNPESSSDKTVVGEKGESSSRVISTSGRENTTFVLAANAAGKRAPPLIIFKAKNIWDQWRAPPEKEYPGTAYAASPNGWMETEIFTNYFEKVLIPALGPERPVLVIYDGHSTHVSLKLVELALAKEITIIKLPAHTSDLLQPLDVSVFKSFKQKWDQTVASWQRQNIGQRLPKSLFSQFLGETWLIVSEDVIMSGFSKSGIYPFNSDVIPKGNFSKESLERWEKHQKETQDTAQDNIAFVEDVEYAEHNVNAPSPSILSSSGFEEVTPITTNLENQPDFTSPPLDAKEKLTSEVQNLTVTSLE